MIHRMLAALKTAGAADIGTDTADGSGKLRRPAHHADRQATDIRAITVQANAFRQFRGIIFCQTRPVTCLAGLLALSASVNAILISCFQHDRLSLRRNNT
jgi:hypothetical protein